MNAILFDVTRFSTPVQTGPGAGLDSVILSDLHYFIKIYFVPFRLLIQH